MRDQNGNVGYWDERVNKDWGWIHKAEGLLEGVEANPAYTPQFSFDLSKDFVRLLLRCYSRGDSDYMSKGLLEKSLYYWEFSNQRAEVICAQNNLKICRSWTFELNNLNHYNWCFWIVGLALALDIPDDQWQRLLKLIDGAGEDVLLDRVIASRQSDRPIGSRLLHPKPYSRLLEAIDAPREQQADLLREFVEHWYAELARKSSDELWWYIYGDPVKHPLEKGSYFGRWCLEAVAAVKAFGLDDSQCLGHEHYPGDLLRPNGPSTHPVRPEPKRGWLSKLLGR
ncbi:DUF1911 domain-containing protein [Pseudomonas aeruginosa]|nr:DUF1911 domain-containing protein [Pseudomonas aeruginosa]